MKHPAAPRPATADRPKRNPLAHDPGRVSVVEEPTRKGSVSDPRRDPTGPIAEREQRPARDAVRQPARQGSETAQRDAAEARRAIAAQAERSRELRNARAAENKPVYSMPPRTATAAVSTARPANDATKAKRNSDDPRSAFSAAEASEWLGGPDPSGRKELRPPAEGRKPASQQGAGGYPANDAAKREVVEGRKYPSHGGGAYPANDPARREPVEERKHPSQHGSVEGRKYPSHAGAGGAANDPSRRNAVEGRKYPSQHGAGAYSASDPARREAVEGRKYPSQQGAGAYSANDSTRREAVAGRKYPSHQGAGSPPNDPARRDAVEGRKYPSHSGTSPSANDPARRDAAEGRKYPSQPGAGTAAANVAARRRAAAQSGALDVYCEIDGRSVPIEPTDLSAAGLFVHTPRPEPLDSEVTVLLRIAGLQFEASGLVVQSVALEAAKKDQLRPGFGILFTHLQEDVRARLRDTIDTALSERTERLRSLSASSDRPVSGPKPPPPVDPKERELLDQLRADLARLQAEPPWTVLGISQGADAATAHSAFLAASKRYHPHVYARYALPEIKDTVTQLFIACKRAYTTLTKTSRAPKNAPARSSDPGNR